VCVCSAARQGKTKFHDPSQAIYLNSVSRRSNSQNRHSGFLLGSIGNAAGNRLANGFVQDRSSGSWRNSAAATGQQLPQEDVSETEVLKSAPTDHQVED